jgi:hypothetical protein
MINQNIPPLASLDSQLKDINSFSFYQNPISNKHPLKSISLLDTFNLITGTDYLEITNTLRSITEHKAKNKFKTSHFPYTTFCGVFSERAESKLLCPSNLFCIDLDHLGVNLNKIRQRLVNDSKLNPFLIFTSPSGDGLKVIIGINYNEIASENTERVTVAVWQAVNQYFFQKYSDLITPNKTGNLIDACKELSRACFLCHDADAYYNENNNSLLGQEFIQEMIPKGMDVAIPDKPTNTKGVNSKTNFLNLAKRHTLEVDNHHPQLLAFIGAAKNLSFPQNQVVEYINQFIHISPDSKHAEGAGIKELVKKVYQLYSTDDSEIKYLTPTSIGYKLFLYKYSKTTQNYELAGMHWDEVRNELHRAGFAKRKFGSNYGYIKVNGCIIYECSDDDMCDYLTNIIISMDDLKFNYQGNNYQTTSAALREIFWKNSKNFFNNNWLRHLEKHNTPIIKDTQEKMYFFFKNCLVTISKDEGLQTKQWGDIEDYCVWGSQIIQQDYSYVTDFKTSHFYRFIQNVCGTDSKRYEAMKTALGYSLHHYYNESEGQAVIFLDETITNLGKPMGGTGKGLIVNALKQLRNVAKIDGKHFRAENRFCWEMVTPSTQIIWIDDIKPDFDFSALHSNLTDGWTIEKKNVSQFYIEPNDSPKTVITSNSVIAGDGTTNKRRQFVVELSDFYSRQIVNGDEKPIESTHGCIFFNDTYWDSNEWNMFYGFLFDCALQYLTTGLLSYAGVNIENNRFRQATDEDFVEWISEQGFIKNSEYTTSEKYKDYITQFYGDSSIPIGQKKFTNYIKAYATFKKWTYNRIQKNGISYFFFT